MWGFFQHIIQSYLSDDGVVGEYLAQAGVPLINFMVKAPEHFVQAAPGQSSALDMLCQFVERIFAISFECESEMDSATGVTLLMAMLEHLGQGNPAVQARLHGP